MNNKETMISLLARQKVGITREEYIEMLNGDKPLEKMFAAAKGDFTKEDFEKFLTNDSQIMRRILLTNPSLPSSFVSKIFDEGSFGEKLAIAKRLTDNEIIVLLNETIRSNDNKGIANLSGKIMDRKPISPKLEKKLWEAVQDFPVLKIMMMSEGLGPVENGEEIAKEKIGNMVTVAMNMTTEEEFKAFIQKDGNIAKFVSVLAPGTPSSILDSIAVDEDSLLSSMVIGMRSGELSPDTLVEAANKSAEPALKMLLLSSPKFPEEAKAKVLESLGKKDKNANIFIASVLEEVTGDMMESIKDSVKQ